MREKRASDIVEDGNRQTRLKKTKPGWIYLGTMTLFVGIGALVLTALADAPVLTITPLGSNQFSVVITNGVSTTNYTLYWTPALNDTNYPWEVLAAGDIGETNFTIDAGTWPSKFYKVLVGLDSDGDGVPDWEDADPNNSSIGILAVTIDSPLNGSTLQ